MILIIVSTFPTADVKQATINSGNSNWLGNEPVDDFDEQEEEEEEYYDNADDEQNQHQQQQVQHQQQQHQQQRIPQQYHQQHQYTSHSGGNGQSPGLRLYSRVRRDTSDPSQSELDSKMKCNRTECAHVRCVVSNLEKDSSAWIALRMRLVTQTLNSVSRQFHVC